MYTGSRRVFLPRLPRKTVHGNSVSAEGASEKELDSGQQNLIKQFQCYCKITCISRLHKSRALANVCFGPRVQPKIIHCTFESAKGASEEHFKPKLQNLINSFILAVKLRAFQDCVNHTGSGLVWVFFDAPLNKSNLP